MNKKNDIEIQEDYKAIQRFKYALTELLDFENLHISFSGTLKQIFNEFSKSEFDQIRKLLHQKNTNPVTRPDMPIIQAGLDHINNPQNRTINIPMNQNYDVSQDNLPALPIDQSKNVVTTLSVCQKLVKQQIFIVEVSQNSYLYKKFWLEIERLFSKQYDFTKKNISEPISGPTLFVIDYNDSRLFSEESLEQLLQWPTSI